QERLIRSYAELADSVIRLVDGKTSTRADIFVLRPGRAARTQVRRSAAPGWAASSCAGRRRWACAW
ncbi:hypothetical protein, partial [Streptomyces sp. NPDC005336]|uniref:hypothetical protein n=1 Tax=Streptomyces sp. NPDC005336 TaxID=3157035 RepID=UPI0033BAEB66